MPEARWSSLSLVLFLLGLACRATSAPGVLSATVFAACYVSGGWEPGLVGLRALRARTLDVDLLMIVAALGAAGIGELVDGGLLIFAATVICTLVVIDLVGHLPLPLGVAGHEGSTVIVGLNGLRLLRSRVRTHEG